MQPSINPLSSALRGADASAPELGAIFGAARMHGVTPAERETLEAYAAEFRSGWTRSTRSEWSGRMGRLARGPSAAPTTAVGVADPEDLSGQLSQVWMAGYGDATQQIYVEDMVRLGRELGFRLVLQMPQGTDESMVLAEIAWRLDISVRDAARSVHIVETPGQFSVWGEDNKILMTAGATGQTHVLVPPQPQGDALQYAEAFAQTEGYHPFEPGSFLGAVSYRREDEAAASMARAMGVSRHVGRFAFEGGNVLPATGASPYAVIGRDSLLVTTFHLAATGEFSDRQVDERAYELQSSSAEIRDTQNKLAQAGWGVNGWGWVTKETARRFLALMDLSKDAIAADLGIDRKNLVFVTQPEFHVDMAMRPTQPGEMMLHHPQAALNLIDRVLKDIHSGAEVVEEWQYDELLQFRAHAQHEWEERGPIYTQIMRELTEAGIKVIPAPGHMYSAATARRANFMNGIPCTVGDRQLYMTNASSIGALERAFARFMDTECGVPEDHVRFVGRETVTGGAAPFTASEYSASLSGGLDCRTVDFGGAA